MPVRSWPVSRLDGPVGRVSLVGLLGLLHVQGEMMSRNYGIRPQHTRVYEPPVKALSRTAILLTMLAGATLFALMLTGMMVLAQFIYWVIP